MKQIAPCKVESKTLFRLTGAMNLCRADFNQDGHLD